MMFNVGTIRVPVWLDVTKIVNIVSFLRSTWFGESDWLISNKRPIDGDLTKIDLPTPKPLKTGSIIRCSGW